MFEILLMFFVWLLATGKYRDWLGLVSSAPNTSVQPKNSGSGGKILKFPNGDKWL